MLISIAQKIVDSDFSSPRFDVPNTRNLASGGIQNRETNETGNDRGVISSLKFRGKQVQIFHSLTYCELRNWTGNGTKVCCL